MGTGWTLAEVSEALLLDTETLRHYVAKYRDGKIEEVLQLNYTGRKSRLTDEQKEELKTHLCEYTYSDVKAILGYVKKTIYKSTAMRAILSDIRVCL